MTTTRRSAIAALIGGALTMLGLRPARAQDWIIQAIYDAAARYGVSGDWLLSVARCESGLNPGVTGKHGEQGLYQILPSTWDEFGCSGDPYNAVDSVECAAWAFAQGYSHRWCCSGDWAGGWCE